MHRPRRFRRLSTGVDASQPQEATCDELRKLIQERTRTATAEAKHIADMGVLVEADKALAFVRALLEAARDVIQDTDTYRRLNARTLQLLPPSEEAS